MGVRFQTAVAPLSVDRRQLPGVLVGRDVHGKTDIVDVRPRICRSSLDAHPLVDRHLLLDDVLAGTRLFEVRWSNGRCNAGHFHQSDVASRADDLAGELVWQLWRGRRLSNCNLDDGAEPDANSYQAF